MRTCSVVFDFMSSTSSELTNEINPVVSSNKIQILDGAVRILHSVIIFEKGIKFTLLPPALGKYNGTLVTFTSIWQLAQEKKHFEFKAVKLSFKKLTLCHILLCQMGCVNIWWDVCCYIGRQYCKSNMNNHKITN